MADGEETASKAHLRVNHVEENVKEIKEDVKGNKVLIVQNSIDIASLKTELRIFGGMILAVLITIAVNAIVG